MYLPYGNDIIKKGTKTDLRWEKKREHDFVAVRAHTYVQGHYLENYNNVLKIFQRTPGGYVWKNPAKS